MILGIDAWNIRAGGGVTHLKGLLGAARPRDFGVEEVVVWCGESVAAKLPDQPWLTVETPPELDGSLGRRLAWQLRAAREVRSRVDLLLVPGGFYWGSMRPFVTMSRNLLPFDEEERSRFPLVRNGLRYRLLEFAQSRTFRRAAGVIFLTRHARSVVTDRTGPLAGMVDVIPHGVEDRFRFAPDRSPPDDRAFRWLYVSVVNLYKHPWVVAEAAARLRADGRSLSVDFVGGAYSPALRRLRSTLDRLDPDDEFLHYRGWVPHSDLTRWYADADGFVFASSCENMPNILVEAMSAGLPIASSDRGPMPEVLDGAGLMFDPEDSASVARAMAQIMDDDDLRERLARASWARAREFSWSRCASETFEFLRRVHSEERVGAPRE